MRTKQAEREENKVREKKMVMTEIEKMREREREK